MPTKLDAEARAKLSSAAASHYEAQLFADRTPEFFQCPANAKIMLDFMQAKNLALTAPNFDKSFKALRAAHKILPASSAIEQMPAEEFLRIAEEIGEPVVDGHGRVVGHNLPGYITRPETWRDESASRIGTSNDASDYATVSEAAIGKKITPAELALMDATQVRLFCKANRIENDEQFRAHVVNEI